MSLVYLCKSNNFSTQIERESQSHRFHHPTRLRDSIKTSSANPLQSIIWSSWEWYTSSSLIPPYLSLFFVHFYWFIRIINNISFVLHLIWVYNLYPIHIAHPIISLVDPSSFHHPSCPPWFPACNTKGPASEKGWSPYIPCILPILAMVYRCFQIHISCFGVFLVWFQVLKWFRGKWWFWRILEIKW